MNYFSKTMKRFFIAVLLIVSGIFLYQYSNVDKPMLVNTQGMIFEKASVQSIIKDNLQENGSRIGDQIVSLKLSSDNNKGQLIEANCPNGMLFGTVCKPGMNVIVISSRIGTMDTYTVYSMDRAIPIFSFIGIFFLMLCLIGGKKGIRSAAALVFTFICFLFLFFPMILRGASPIMAAIITSCIVLAATIYLINGLTIKSLAAGLSSFGGVLSAGLAAILFSNQAALSGYNVSNIEALIFVGQNTKIDVGQILFAGILFASLGAVMDIAMDVSSAINELRRINPQMNSWELFTSGMNVGRDVMGTMTTTLILAFFGGSLGIWVLDYAYDLPYLQLINSNSVGIEIMQGLSGSIGVIVTVPLTAVFSVWLPVIIERCKIRIKDFYKQKKLLLKHKEG